MPKHALILATLLLAACSSAPVKHGDQKLAAVEDDARTRTIAILNQLDYFERNAIRHDAPSTVAKPLTDGRVLVNMIWNLHAGKQVIARFVGDPATPAKGKFEAYMVQRPIPAR